MLEKIFFFGKIIPERKDKDDGEGDFLRHRTSDLVEDCQG